MFRFPIILITFFIIFITPSSFADSLSSCGGQFSIFFDYIGLKDLSYCPRVGAVRCVLGSISPHEKIYLLSSVNSDICLAKTIQSFESGWDNGSFPLTKINLSRCPNLSFSIALKSKIAPAYKRLENLVSPSVSVASEIDKNIREQSSSFSPSVSEHQFQLSPEMPKIIHLPNMAADVYVVIYQNSITPGDQVHFLYAPNKVKLIHAAASIKNIFALGDVSYIHYSFTCRVGCGYGGNVIVKFSMKDFETVLFDTSTSS